MDRTAGQSGAGVSDERTSARAWTQSRGDEAANVECDRRLPMHNLGTESCSCGAPLTLALNMYAWKATAVMAGGRADDERSDEIAMETRQRRHRRRPNDGGNSGGGRVFAVGRVDAAEGVGKRTKNGRTGAPETWHTMQGVASFHRHRSAWKEGE